jgi:hypothetical protein
VALHARDEAQARAAIAGLRDAKPLAGVAKSAALPAAREAALAALRDPRALAGVVREAAEPRTRQLALARIEDEATLLVLAQNLEQKALAVAAVDRLTETDSLRAVAERARVPAASRRARARLETGEPALEPAPPAQAAHDDEAERRAYEEARARLERELEEARAREAAQTAAREAAALGEAEQAERSRRQQLEEIVARAEALASDEAAATRDALRELERRFEAAAAGAAPAELRERLRAALDGLQARRSAEHDAHARRQRELTEKLAALADRGEALASGERPSLRDADQALRELKEALAHPDPLLPRRERDAVLARLEAARRKLYPLVVQLREDAEWRRWANASVQEELAARAEALVGESNLDRAAAVLHELDRQWRQAKEAPRDQAETLWTRFKAARDQVKARVDAHLAAQEQQQAANLARKEALCAQAEALAESTDWVRTAQALRALQAEWKAIGPVPRAVSQRVWERFRKPCDLFFARFEEHRQARGREWEENLARKLALCEQAETLAASTSWDEAAAAIKKLQADWRTIGPVKKSKSDAVWERFRAACDLFFDRYKNRDAHAREAALKAREGILAELEALSSPEAPPTEPPADLVARVLAAQTAWRQAGGLPQQELEALDARFHAARDRVLETYPAAFAGSELDPEAIRRRAEKLVARATELVQGLEPRQSSGSESAMDLAARLRDALASNTIAGREGLEQRWQSASNELETVTTAWKRLGVLPGASGRELAERFERALRRFSELRPRTEPRGPARPPERRPRERPGRPRR